MGYFCFNSSLVRLGVEDRFKESPLSFEVSIPAWCDWETTLELAKSRIDQSFNSSLVRLGDN